MFGQRWQRGIPTSFLLQAIKIYTHVPADSLGYECGLAFGFGIPWS